jgi:hypothetical protein
LIDLTSYLCFGVIVGSIGWVSIQLYFWTEEIIRVANSFIAAAPGLPSLLAVSVSILYVRIIDPFMNVIEGGGSQLEAFLSLLPTEPQILNWSSHIVTVISNNYQIAWSNAACGFIDFFSIPLQIGGVHLDFTGLLARCIIGMLNPVFGVGIPTILDKIASIFIRWM